MAKPPSRKESRSLRELDALAKMNREIQGATTLDELLKALVQNAVIGVNFERGLVYLLEDGYLRCVASLDRVKTDRAKILKKRVGFSMSVDTLETLAVKEGRPLYTADTAKDPRIGEKYRKITDSREYCVVPLSGRSGVLGVFTGDKFYSKDPITPGDIETLELFAGQVSLAVENARLHEEAKRFSALLEETVEERTRELAQANASVSRKIQELSTLFGIANLLNKTLETGEVVSQVLTLLTRMGYGYSALHFHEFPERNLAASASFREEYLLPRNLRLLKTLLPVLTAQGEPRAHSLERILEKKGADDSVFAKLGLRGVLAVPLLSGGRPLAHLLIFHGSSSEIDEESISFFAAFAKQAGVALDRAETFGKVKEERDASERLSLKLASENTYMKDRLHTGFNPEALIGLDRGLKTTMELVYKVAPTTATVTILGETGTGKELLARAVHALSPRESGPFVTVNCAAIPEELLESELFGYERGAFTGAYRQKQGLFEIAAGGTIFLDEIGEISPKVQGKLLRVLQEQEITRLGGTTPIKVDARVVAATNRNLEDQGFRSDLFYRLNVFPITVPPLRARPGDVEPLARFFAEKYKGAKNRKAGFTPEALKYLKSYSWPGNVRELENVVERLMILTEAETITAAHLPKEIVEGGREAPAVVPLAEAVRELKREAVAAALAHTGGNQSKAAALLGLERSNLNRLLKTLGTPAFKPSQG